MSIVIMGTPVSSENRGVLALGSSLIKLCAQASPDITLILLLNDRNSRSVFFRINGVPREIPVISVRLSLRSRLRDHLLWIVLLSILYRLIPLAIFRTFIVNSSPWIKAIHDADFVGGIHGGDSFSDIYGLKRFFLGFFIDWSVVLVKGTMVQFPQTYGPYKSAISRSLTRSILKRSSVIIARDRHSRQVAQNLVGLNREVLLCPDVAFSLESIVPETIEMEPPLRGPMPPGIIGLNVNGLMYNGGYTRSNMFGLKLDYASFLPGLVKALLSKIPGDIWLIPHTFAPNGDVESDPEASRQLRETLPLELRSRIRIITREYDQHEIKGIIGQCDFFIGSRMHACIAALSQGIPCVGIAYSMKFRGVFETVGMEDWVVDGKEATSEYSVARILELYQQRNDIRDSLHKRAADARDQLDSLFCKLV